MSQKLTFLQKYPDRVTRRILLSFGYKSLYLQTSKARHHVYHYEGIGKLPPLIVLHGGGDSASTFLPILVKCRKYFKEIITIDAAGHGLSEKPQSPFGFEGHYQTTNEVINEYASESSPVIIMGNSLGGLTALHYARRSPEHVLGLFLLSPMGAPMSRQELDDLYASFRIKSAKDAEAFARRVYHELPAYKMLFVKRLVLAWMRRETIQELVEATTLDDGITNRQLTTIHMPVEMICGQSDRILTPGAIDFFKQNLPNVIIKRPENVGHCPHIEKSDMVVSDLLEFTDRVIQKATGKSF